VVEVIRSVPHLKALTRYASRLRASTRGVEVSERAQFREGWQIDEPIDAPGLAGCTRLDARIEWSLTGQVSAVVTGQNLLDGSHREFQWHRTNMQPTLLP
jgi:hypothetical protein